MPRDGPDNGPIETGKDQVHGASGDTTLKHTQNVAPMPEGEKGFAIEGLNASGGGSAPSAPAASSTDDSKKDDAKKS